MQHIVANSWLESNSYLLVPGEVAHSYSTHMRPKDIRRQNLLLLVSEFGTITEVAKRSGTSEKYLSQIINQVVQRNSPRGMGDVVATKIEDGCGKYKGWIDEPHGTGLPPKEEQFAEQVMKELSEREVKEHVMQTILSILSSSPKKNS